MVVYKYYYFNIRGRGELVRLVFAAAGQVYEDIRFERDEWIDYKNKAPFGRAPFLEVIEGNKSFVMSQSIAITRFLARKFGLAGKNENERAEVDMYIDQASDFLTECNNILREKYDGNKRFMTEHFDPEDFLNNLKLFDSRLPKSNSGYLCPSGLTIADLYLYNIMEIFGDKKAQILDSLPNIKILDQKIRQLPKIAEYLAKRPRNLISTNTQYKFYYFNMRGRGELTRLIFAAAGQYFDDVRFEQDQWPEYKKKAPFGKAPYLEVITDSKTYVVSQSISIARFLARKFDLAGKTDLEQAEVEMYSDKANDLFNEYANKDKEETKKKSNTDKADAEILAHTFKLFETKIIRSQSGFLFPSGLTWVDLYIMCIGDILGDKKDKHLENYPNLKNLDNKVRSLPKIAEWIARRPKTAM